MRDISRAKRIDNGSWVYGAPCTNNAILTNNKNECSMAVFEGKNIWWAWVDVATVGKYTGLKDTNGIKIFEGDVATVFGHTFRIVYEIGSFMLSRESHETNMYDLFDNCWNDDVYPLSQLYWETECEENFIEELKIITNIHDNKGE